MLPKRHREDLGTRGPGDDGGVSQHFALHCHLSEGSRLRNSRWRRRELRVFLWEGRDRAPVAGWDKGRPSELSAPAPCGSRQALGELPSDIAECCDKASSSSIQLEK